MSRGNGILIIVLGLLVLYLGATGRYKYLKALVTGEPDGDKNESMIQGNIDKNIKELDNLTPLKVENLK